MKLILFDIDKTLVGSCACAIEAHTKAFKKVYGVDTSINIIDHSGMTERKVVLEVLKKNRLDEKTIMSKMEECTKAINEAFEKAFVNERLEVMPGVRGLLAELDKQDVLLGLVTGNTEDRAKLKLKKVGLGHYFKVGGFGDEAIERIELIQTAIKKAKELGFEFSKVFVIGDTPRDILAGKELGVITIGVGTGKFSEQELKQVGADFAFKDLTDKDQLLKILS